MKPVQFSIDGKNIECPEGQSILWAALDHHIYIPNLCALREKGEPEGACRLCFVEVEGESLPVTACTTGVKGGMVVHTKGARALRLARTAFQLMLSNHPVDCAHCLKSGSCALQEISKHLGVKLNTKRFKKFLRELPVDETSPVFIYDPNKCVLCSRCVWLCEKLEPGSIGFAHRGFGRRVSAFGDEPVGLSGCRNRVELAGICPVGAFVAKDKEHRKKTAKAIGG